MQQTHHPASDGRIILMGWSCSSSAPHLWCLLLNCSVAGCLNAMAFRRILLRRRGWGRWRGVWGGSGWGGIDVDIVGIVNSIRDWVICFSLSSEDFETRLYWYLFFFGFAFEVWWIWSDSIYLALSTTLLLHIYTLLVHLRLNRYYNNVNLKNSETIRQRAFAVLCFLFFFFILFLHSLEFLFIRSPHVVCLSWCIIHTINIVIL